jgi:hypothetical protein
MKTPGRLGLFGSSQRGYSACLANRKQNVVEYANQLSEELMRCERQQHLGAALCEHGPDRSDQANGFTSASL